MSLSDIEFKPVEVTSPGMTGLLKTMRQMYANGGAMLLGFEAVDADAFDRENKPRLGDKKRARQMLGAAAVRAAAPELELPAHIAKLPRRRRYGSFELEGAITQMVLNGGAYEGSGLSDAEARALSADFVNELLEDRRDEALIYVFGGAWSPWFQDIAWDHSFFVFDRKARRFWLFCATDVD